MISFLSFLSKSSQFAKGGSKSLIAILLISASAMAQNPLQVQMVPKFYAGGYNITCFGGNNGRINTQVTGGVPPYTYQWSHGATSANVQNLVANTYTVTVTDANANSVSAQVDLYQPKAIVDRVHKSDYNGFNISKEGANDGDVKIEIDGGNTPYTIQWSNAQSGEYVNQLEAGAYIYTIIDMSGCVKTGNINMTQPGPFSASVNVIQNMSCHKGEKDGIAVATATGGQPPYLFKWDNGEFTDTAKYLYKGQHQVIVYDANWAEVVLTVTINMPDYFEATLNPLVYPNGHNTSCADCCNGQISATIAGGTAPFTYLWSNEQQTAQLENLCEGYYNLGVIDSKGCKTEASAFLSAPKANNWNLTGNANSDPNTQFIGTTDQKDLVFKTNNTETFRLGADGNVNVSNSLRIGAFENQVLTGNLFNIPTIAYNGILRSDMNKPFEFVPTIGRPCRRPGAIDAWQFAAISESNEGYDLDKINYFGKVGINVCFPNQELHVNGTGLINGNLIATGSTIIGAENTGNQWTNNEPTLYINNSGASSALHINALGKTDYSFIQHIKTDNAKAKVFNVDLNDQSKFTIYGNGNVVIGGFEEFGYEFVNNLNKSYFRENVRIGKTLQVDQKVAIGGDIADNNNCKLAVNGKIGARSLDIIKPSMPFPDYVFKEDYCLDSLSEIEQFIKQFKHLPGVMSESEVTEKGSIEVLKLQLQLLEKIEELYLHVIELEKKIK